MATEEYQDQSDKYQFLTLPTKPARLTAEQAAYLLGFAIHDIPILINRGLLKPLGAPPPNGVRYFACIELQALGKNRKWLDKASFALVNHWQTKNAKRCGKHRDGLAA